jgi:hypothetical protein
MSKPPRSEECQARQKNCIYKYEYYLTTGYVNFAAMQKIVLVLSLAIIAGIGPVIQKFSYGANSHPDYDSRVPGK